MCVCVCVCLYVCVCVLHFLLTYGQSLVSSADSGNGTGSTNSSRPQSQVISEAHTTPSNNDSPQLKPSASTAAPKEDVQLLNKVPENKRDEDATSVEVKNKKETSGADVPRKSNDLVASNNGAKDTPIDSTNDKIDKPDDKAKDTTSDTTKDITSDATKDTTSDTTKDITNDTTTDTTSDTVKDTVSNMETVQSKVVAKDTATDSISDITEDAITNKAWLDKHEQKITEEKPVDTKKNVDKLDLQNNFEDVEGDDVFVEMPTPIRKSHFGPASPMSPSMSPRLSVGTCSPINMSPRPRRSSFVSSPSHCVCTLVEVMFNLHSTACLRPLLLSLINL